ncbi:ABC transporter ATP-binding protein/permease [Actinoplanes hulinensis]|uniref:ABC transporter ATP-binding protein/permease n=1 Tax=Actinoplanes hulinensis TaxID=1144547 RepID=A0ABS7B9I6_9ACTN|nr:ABC transporter ATP-binding protein [Actinoplanes hulinensis]MBW6437301.1 ABC transporter ATP-binding protein/permease [Actinoplanes hulinensis]MBW6437308.1 ABC transporter ATP-binding protein/permease [Actinoplanes hulinensis]
MFEILRRFGPNLRPYRPRMMAGGVLVMLVAAVELAQPWPLMVVVDDVLRQRPPSGLFGNLLGPVADSPTAVLAVCALSLVALAALAALGTYLASRLLQGVGERLVADLRTDIFDHLQRLSLTFHDQQRVGDLATRLTGDVTAIQALLVAAFSTLLPNLALLIGIVIVAIAIQPVFAVLLLCVTPALYAVVRHYRGAIKHASREARTHEGRVSGHVTETLTTIRLVQSFAAERRVLERFRVHNRARLDAGLRAVELQSRLPAAVELVAQAGRATVLFVGATLVLRGQLSLGVLLVLLAYLQQVYAPMKALARLTSTISKAQAGTERVEEVLRSTAVVHERPDAIPAPRLSGDVELRNVCFGYQPDQPVLHEVSLHVRPGQVVAFAGHTGAGKSTIATLVPRLYDVTAGQVLLDGHDVRDLTLRSVRSQVAVVLQEPLMVSGTILDNIAYGAPHASRDELLAAAQAAYVDEFVDRLPHKYDTQVAEGGLSLSGGQRQRVAIARALAADTPIVVLDEPTSGLDPVSESYVMRGLARLTAGRTVLVIAHRLTTLRHADQVYVIDHGHIVEAGTHAELSTRPGRFRDMNELLAAPSLASSSSASTVAGHHHSTQPQGPVNHEYQDSPVRGSP